MKKILLLMLLAISFFVLSQKGVNAAECLDTAPVGTPNIYQIDRNSNSAVLHITPAGIPYTEYVVSYGFNEGDERFGATFPQGATNDNLTFTIANLDPGSTYYFKVRAGNNCQTGQWSAWYSSKGSAVLAATDTATDTAGTDSTTPTLPVTGAPSYLVLLTIALPIIFIIAGVLL
jgi:hypothetical protein